LPIEKQATIKDLLAARSGVFKDREILDPKYLPERGSKEPGTYWYYGSWGFNAVGHIFELKSGNNIYYEVESQLAIPLNFQDWDRSEQHKIYNEGVSNFPQYQMWFSTRDMARIGYMMLNDGRWKDKQIISKDWKESMLKERTKNKEIVKSIPTYKSEHFELGYGYLWWLIHRENDFQFKNSYLASGARGQAIVVYPEIETVLAYVTSEIYQRSNPMEVRDNIYYKAGLMYDPDWKKNYVTSESFKPIKLTDKQITPLLGNYKRENSPPVTILKGDEGLTIIFPDGRKQELIPISENKFVLKDQFIIDGIFKTVEFIKNEKGIVQRVEVKSTSDFSLQKLL
jgi:CubicO group peptidase (beta-lactamase class C family)